MYVVTLMEAKMTTPNKVTDILSLKDIEDFYEKMGINEEDCHRPDFQYNIDAPIKQVSLFKEDQGSTISNN